MKKTAFFVPCFLLLCGGLFCLHLTAQPKTDSSAKPNSLLDRKINLYSERELLELKVASYRKIVDSITISHAVANRTGDAIRLAEARADLAAAEIEFYRYTGERDKLLISLETKIDTLTDKLRIVSKLYEVDMIPQTVLCAAEIQLLDALLEQKRVGTSLNGE